MVPMSEGRGTVLRPAPSLRPCKQSFTPIRPSAYEPLNTPAVPGDAALRCGPGASSCLHALWSSDQHGVDVWELLDGSAGQVIAREAGDDAVDGAGVPVRCACTTSPRRPLPVPRRCNGSSYRSPPLPTGSRTHCSTVTCGRNRSSRSCCPAPWNWSWRASAYSRPVPRSSRSTRTTRPTGSPTCCGRVPRARRGCRTVTAAPSDTHGFPIVGHGCGGVVGALLTARPARRPDRDGAVV